MTDETPKVEPCACAMCGYPAWADPRDIGCDNQECLIGWSDLRFATVEDWNTFNDGLLAARRKDFEAGQSSMCDSQERVNTKVAMSFDDYLARGGE